MAIFKKISLYSWKSNITFSSIPLRNICSRWSISFRSCRPHVLRTYLKRTKYPPKKCNLANICSRKNQLHLHIFGWKYCFNCRQWSRCLQKSRFDEIDRWWRSYGKYLPECSCLDAETEIFSLSSVQWL